jgi:hypothetical protein
LKTGVRALGKAVVWCRLPDGGGTGIKLGEALGVVAGLAEGPVGLDVAALDVTAVPVA